MNAPCHHGFDQRADIFFFHRAFVLRKPAGVAAKGHCLVLQVALATLVADRAVQRVVDEQKLHHPLAGLFHHRRFGVDFRWLAIAPGAQIAHPHGAGGNRFWRAHHFDQAHAAIAGYRQPFVVAKTRHISACVLQRLNDRQVVVHLDFGSIDNELGHCATLRSFAISRTPRLAPQRRLFKTFPTEGKIAGAVFIEMRQAGHRFSLVRLVALVDPPHGKVH